MIEVVSRKGLAKHPSGGRLFFAGLIAFALFVQGYATQTHFHKLTGTPTNIALKANGSPEHDRYPLNNDPINCPICQQISHAGQYVAPAWLLPFLILASVSKIEITTSVMPHYDAVSHSWRGRGPPLY
jgi:hypothetical protein